MAKKNKPKPGTPKHQRLLLEAGKRMRQQSVEKIKGVIESKGLTRQAIAKDTGISQSSLSRFLSGDDSRITFDRLMLMLHYLEFDWKITPRKKKRKAVS